jgi:hypothetical protein
MTGHDAIIEEVPLVVEPRDGGPDVDRPQIGESNLTLPEPWLRYPLSG